MIKRLFEKAPQKEEEKRRFMILAHLFELGDFKELSDHMLADALNVQGVPSSIVEVHGSIDWLAQGGYVLRKDYGAIVAAELLRSGVDVVRGVASPDGFLRPPDFVRRS